MSQPYAIFCANPLDPRSAEPDFAAEFEAARSAGFKPVLIDHDELDRHARPSAALRKTRIEEGGVAIYRGWMLRAEAYERLYEALLEKGVRLLTDPSSYAACHQAPGSYDLLREWMPEMASVPESRIDDTNSIRSALASFGSSPVILKDWVKSQAAGYWLEACYISNASDMDEVLRIISRFRELQDGSLVGGLVFKRFLDLQPKGATPYECRAFFVGGRAVGCWPRSEEARRLGLPPSGLLNSVAAKAPSPFASGDFGLDASGRWWLLEVGDGQVSSLPGKQAADPLFAALAHLST